MGDAGSSEPDNNAQTALLRLLAGCWPEARDVSPDDLPLTVDDRAFLAAALVLRDGGFVLYEAMLVGTGPRPVLDQAMLTHKGMMRLRGG